MKRPLSFIFALGLLGAGLEASALKLEKGDRIAIIGNTTAERMQFEGYNHWETLLHQRYSEHELVVRNLSWSADEVVLRPRAEGFGAPDEHLSFSKADVVLAFFGFNESFKKEAGLEQFRSDLTQWIEHTKKQAYNGEGSPRIALVSPLAAENLRNPHLPDGKALNEQLKSYVDAMREIAEKNDIAFADVFTPSLALYEKGSESPYTINGIHLNRHGDKTIAKILDQALFEGPTPADPSETLRKEIENKNLNWYHRYRIVDSYYVYGGRSGLKFADGDQTNADVMQREREVLDVMVANRDKRIWTLAKGGKISDKPDDSNVPPFLEVKTFFGLNQKNQPGESRGQSSKTAEGDSAKILSVEETKKHFTLDKGFSIDCFASEEQFPEIGNVVAMAFDAKGRLWVSTMQSYPQWRPGDPFIDKIVILEDTDGDGKADKSTIFADQLHLPIGFEFHDGGVLISDQRNVTFLKDLDGDDKADFKEVILSGFDSADSHHVINSFTKGNGGDLFFQEGTFHMTQVETPYGPIRCENAGTYRFEPLSHKLEVYVSYNYANPHGIAFDHWGQSFIADASGGRNYFATAFSGFLPYPEKHAPMKDFFPKRVRPTSGAEFVYSRNFPDSMQGNFLLSNCIGVQGTLNHEVRAVESGFEGKEIEPLMLNSDPNFRPVDNEFAPDGSLYIVDWAEALIGHMQYSLRDPLRDQHHGRIWRMVNEEKPLVSPAKIHGATLPELLELLLTPERRTRERAKTEIALRPSKEVVEALTTWMAKLDPNSEGEQHALVEALWVHQWINVVNQPLLEKVLKLSKSEARAAGTRLIAIWRDRLEDPLRLLEAAALDDAPLVRLEAIRGASFFKGKRAAQIALSILQKPTDYYLDYTLGETMRTLKPSPQDIDVEKNPSALAYVLATMNQEELLAAPRVASVLEALLERDGISALERDKAATELATLRSTTRETELILALTRLDSREVKSSTLQDLGKMLAASERSALAKASEPITRLAFKDHGVRQARIAAMAAYVSLLEDPASTWKSRHDNHETLSVLLESLELISKPELRAKFQPVLVEAMDVKLPSKVRRPALSGLAFTGAAHARTNFGLLANELQAGKNLDVVAKTLLTLPRDQWDLSRAQTLAQSLLDYAGKVPVNQRTQQNYVELSQLGNELAKLVEGPTGKEMRKTWRQLSVSVFVIKTVREQMKYDVTEITVEAGKPFEVIFENNDIMPHNIVFVKPSTHMEVGTAAQSMPAKADSQGVMYVPKLDAVLPASYSKMLEPGQKQKLNLTAPTEVGTYQYVCTFPGHWVIMHGKLEVVKSLD